VIVTRITTAMASTWAIVLVPALCLVANHYLSETALTLALSIMAISITQLVLRSGDCDTRAIQRKLDALIKATEDAPDDLVGIEKRAG
jgi:low affinity Fe/Cu permease